MATSRTINGISYVIPDQGDSFSNWGSGIAAWIGAVTNGALFTQGGNFSLTNDVNFGTSYGLTSIYFKSRSAAIANSGVLRLANTDSIVWSGTGTQGDIGLGVSGNNVLTTNVALSATAILVSGDQITFQANGYIQSNGYVAISDSAQANGIVVDIAGYFGGSPGTIYPFSNNQNDLGLSSGFAFRNLYLAGNVVTSTGNLTVGGTSQYSNVGIITTNTNVNCKLNVYQDITLHGNPSITFQNAAPAGTVTNLTLLVRQSANGSNTVTWANTIRWSDNNVPVLSTTANTMDGFTFITYDGGTIWIGAQIYGNVPSANIY